MMLVDDGMQAEMDVLDAADAVLDAALHRLMERADRLQYEPLHALGHRCPDPERAPRRQDDGVCSLAGIALSAVRDVAIVTTLILGAGVATLEVLPDPHRPSLVQASVVSPEIHEPAQPGQ